MHKDEFIVPFGRNLFKVFPRFFEEYHKNGIDFWGITIQNEPTTGQFDWWMWQTCLFTPEMQRWVFSYFK